MGLRQNWKRGLEVLGAYLRQGMHELGSVFYGSQTAAQPPEYGMAWTKPPGMVSDGLRGKSQPSSGRDDAEPSVLAKYVGDSRDVEPPGRDEPEMER